MLHAASSSRWCHDAASQHKAIDDAAAEPFNGVPSCVSALLGAASQLQVGFNAFAFCKTVLASQVGTNLLLICPSCQSVLVQKWGLAPLVAHQCQQLM